MILDVDDGKNDWCHYCHELRQNHARGWKCLYGSTNFYQAVCKECRRLLDTRNTQKRLLPYCAVCCSNDVGP